MSIIKYEKKPFEVAVSNAEQRFVDICGDPKIFAKEAGFALQHIRGSEPLQVIAKNPVGRESIELAIINVALTGLSLNPVYAYSYLIPRKGKCCLDISYKGLIKIATEENTNIASISAMVVYKWDQFEYHEGSVPYVKHIPNMAPDVEDMGKILKDPIKIWEYVVGAYSRAIMRDGTVDIVVMPKWRIWKIYQTSKSKDVPNSPWQNWPEEQIRKTPIKYHSKTLQGTGMNRLQKAVAILNEHEGPEKEAIQGHSNAEELNKRLGNGKNAPGDNTTISLEETFVKLLKAADTQEGLQSAWAMVMQKEDHLSQEAVRRLTAIKNLCKIDLQVTIKEKPTETLPAEEALDEKCKPCKQSEGCMNKNSPARRNNCDGPYLI